MSWYVRYLLTNSEKIREGIADRGIAVDDDIFYIDGEEPIQLAFLSTDNKLDSEEYSDLLSVEIAIEFLSKKNILTDAECILIGCIKTGMGIDDIIKKLPLSKPTVYLAIKSLSNKISFYLGEHFTDIGFIKRLGLTQRQSTTLQKYMETNLL